MLSWAWWRRQRRRRQPGEPTASLLGEHWAKQTFAIYISWNMFRDLLCNFLWPEMPNLPALKLAHLQRSWLNKSFGFEKLLQQYQRCCRGRTKPKCRIFFHFLSHSKNCFWWRRHNVCNSVKARSFLVTKGKEVGMEKNHPKSLEIWKVLWYKLKIYLVLLHKLILTHGCLLCAKLSVSYHWWFRF